MPSTYTGSGIELIADGEQSGTWGQTTNNNLQLITRLTSEAGVISLSGTTHTLTIADGSLSDGQYGVLVFGGAPSGTNTVTVSPNDAKRVFLVKNTTGESVVMTQGSGGNVTIPAGAFKIVYTDGQGAGAEVVDVATNISAVTGTFSGDLTVDTNTLIVDATNNRVGIGASPGFDFDVQIDGGAGPVDARIRNTGTDVADDAILRLVIDGTTAQSNIYFADGDAVAVGRIVYDHTGDDMEFFTGNTQRVTIDSAGNVGIGTSSPVASVDIVPEAGEFNTTYNSFDGVNMFLRGAGTAGNGNYGSGIAWSVVEGSDQKMAAISSVQTGSDANQVGLAFFTHVSTTGSDPLVEAVRITSAGNVGIGTASPGFPLDVQADGGGATISSRILNTGTTAADDAVLRIGTSGTAGDTSIFFGDSGSATVGRVTYDHNNERMEFWTNSTQQVNIDSSGNLGIGTASPAATLHANSGLENLVGLFESTDSGATITLIDNSTTGGSAAEHGLNTVGDQLEIRAVDILSFETATVERVRITAAGNVGIGTTSPSYPLDVQSDGGGAAIEGRIRNTGTALADDAVLRLAIGGTTAQTSIFFGDGDSSTVGRIVYDHTDEHMPFFVDSLETLRLMASQQVYVPKDLLVGTLVLNPAASNVEGHTLRGSGRAEFSADDGVTMYVNRLQDGSLVSFRSAGTGEGSISVAGSTVSYNGGHLSRWSQTADNTRIDLVKGTVMTNLDQMAVWGDEDNEQLNCMAISSVEGDPNVAGAFVNWDNDDDEYTNDMNVAMTGDMIIRIAQGTTVQRGDLLMSAGDGTAKPQGDDIIRSKTIAKVTSTHVTCTYEDGSYCVPCVLMAC
jgi:hypothetical protein